MCMSGIHLWYLLLFQEVDFSLFYSLFMRENMHRLCFSPWPRRNDLARVLSFLNLQRRFITVYILRLRSILAVQLFLKFLCNSTNFGVVPLPGIGTTNTSLLLTSSCLIMCRNWHGSRHCQTQGDDTESRTCRRWTDWCRHHRWSFWKCTSHDTGSRECTPSTEIIAVYVLQ